MATRRDQLRFDVSSDGAPNARRGRSRPAASQRLALTRAEAAEALGISIDSFERYVQPEVRLVRRNSLRLVPVRELERWVDENAALTIDRQ
jgi:hypothetical protein